MMTLDTPRRIAGRLRMYRPIECRMSAEETTTTTRRCKTIEARGAPITSLTNDDERRPLTSHNICGRTTISARVLDRRTRHERRAEGAAGRTREATSDKGQDSKTQQGGRKHETANSATTAPNTPLDIRHF
mmetsp:Transcript_19658/g.36940  ORF Transcript_19658/g.36940 Transcript_19658/m.36940 type:complete len:131 (-) Transcript_19658:151-543(-)